MNRVFLLSPAHSGGKRAALLTRPAASFELARQVQIGAATLGDVFSFCSGLYFRGKLAYARHFAIGPAYIYIITPSRGLVPADTTVGLNELAEFAAVPVDSSQPRFTEALAKTARDLSPNAHEVILLGSVATGKYLDTLHPIFGERLHFPAEFAGRGDMSRGALLLRCVASNQELRYTAVPPVKPKLSRGSGPKLRAKPYAIQKRAEKRIKPGSSDALLPP
jgi:hypothetical protein